MTLQLRGIVVAFVRLITLLCILSSATAAVAQANLEVNTPAIAQLKAAMQARHGQLAAHYASGAIGLTSDGNIAVRDTNAVPLAQRQQVNSLVAAENRDRASLYTEIARANAHPEWEGQIRATFARRWIDNAQPGWYYQAAGGGWIRK